VDHDVVRFAVNREVLHFQSPEAVMFRVMTLIPPIEQTSKAIIRRFDARVSARHNPGDMLNVGLSVAAADGQVASEWGR
jgi:hypothetical protein